MRRVLYAIGLPLATLLAALGCHSDANLRPPKQPEAYNLPPENDPRFSQPVSYPKPLLFQDSIHKADQDPSGVPGTGIRGAGGPAGPGMR
jgi:hypothetical protein